MRSEEVSEQEFRSQIETLKKIARSSRFLELRRNGLEIHASVGFPSSLDSSGQKKLSTQFILVHGKRCLGKKCEGFWVVLWALGWRSQRRV